MRQELKIKISNIINGELKRVIVDELEQLFEAEIKIAYAEGFTNAQALELKNKQKTCLHKNIHKYYGKHNAEICDDCNLLLRYLE